MQASKQMVVKLSDEGVIRDVRHEAQVADRSMAGQVEHWVKIGQAIEAILGTAEIKALKEHLGQFARTATVGDVESKVVSAVARVMATQDREGVKARIAGSGVPIYQADPDHAGRVVRILPDGTRASGRVKDGVFVPSPTRR